MNPLNIVIIGGVAGGASAGAKARRMNEYAKITIFEKGPYISYANCGLPYYISGEIAEKEKLILQNPDSFKKRFNIDVCVNHEVKFIDKEKKTVNVRNLKTSEDITVPYDTLILSPGAISVVPPIPGLDATNIFTLRTVPEAEKLLNYIKKINHRKL